MVPCSLISTALSARKTELALTWSSSVWDPRSDALPANCRKVPPPLFLGRPKLPPSSKEGMRMRARPNYGRAPPSAYESDTDSSSEETLESTKGSHNSIRKQACAHGAVKDFLKKSNDKSKSVRITAMKPREEQIVLHDSEERPSVTKGHRKSAFIGRPVKIHRPTVVKPSSPGPSGSGGYTSDTMPEVPPDLADGTNDEVEADDLFEEGSTQSRGKARARGSDATGNYLNAVEEDAERSFPAMAAKSSKFIQQKKLSIGSLTVNLSANKRRGTLPVRVRMNSRMMRLEQLRIDRARQAKTQTRQENKKKRFDELLKKERDALTDAFRRFDIDRSGYLDHAEVIACLREFGLTGVSADEKRAILDICVEATRSDEESSSTIRRKEDVEIDLIDFALTVVPCVRQALLELRSDELLKHFFRFDLDGRGKLTQKEMKEIARTLGLDPRMMCMGDVVSDATEIDFQTFLEMTIRGREQLERTCREKERAIQMMCSMSEPVFQKYRRDLVPLHDLFARYDTVKKGIISKSELLPMLQECGMAPRNQQEKNDMVVLFREVKSDGAKENDITFGDFLDIVREIRRYRICKNEIKELEHFHKYDRDKSGYLNCAEISRLLEDKNLNPTNRVEQEEIANLLASVDDDGSGFIEFNEFQELSQRIEEKLRSLRHERDIEFAMCLGFTELQMRDIRQVFSTLDADGSDRLDADEVRMGLGMMQKNVSHKVFEETFKALDKDGNGDLDFLEFLSFMKMIMEYQGFETQKIEETQKLAQRPRDLDIRILRRVLEYFRLAKHYIQSLAHDDLVNLFCEYFNLKPDQNLQLALEVKTVGDLYRIAQDRDLVMTGGADQN